LVIVRKKNNKSKEIEAPKMANISYEILGSFSHDVTSFTEGFFIQDGNIYESTGSPDERMKSVIGVLDTLSGKLDVKVILEGSQFFGEVAVVLQGKLYQLTYKKQTCFVYDAKTFKNIGSFSNPNKEGWGLTTDGTSLIMSDGTFKLTFINPSDFSIVQALNVKENGYGVEKINELEYVSGYIYANVWMTNDIFK
jgi:glutamine cyclotransferase